MSLPYNATLLTKHDLSSCRPMFALYLDIQKRIDIDTLDSDEVRGRWKSFTGKWNRGELAEGWYDPQTLAKAQAREQQYQDERQEQQKLSGIASRKRKRSPRSHQDNENENDNIDDDDDFGPPPPPLSSQALAHALTTPGSSRAGPTVPTTSDLLARHDDEHDLALAKRKQHSHTLHATRKAENAQTKDRLNELVPRADPGTRERQLEKKREQADSNRAFAAAKEGGGDLELRDSELMGEEEDLAEFKRMKKEQDRKKNERELRREEFLRARMAEREEKMRVRQEKEDKTMAMLKDLARQRFG